MIPPGIRSGEQPPYHRLDEYLFQEMCCDLFQNEPEITSCSIYGIRGQSQKGIDLLAHRRDGNIEVGQCKRYQMFSVGQIVQASDEFFDNWDHWKNKNVKRFILFVSCSLDRQEQQEEILRQKERFKKHGIIYEAWHSRVLTNKLRPYPNIVTMYLTPPEYWVSYICGIASAPGDIQSRASVVISEVISTQLIHLSNRLASEIQLRLEQMRTVWRQGRLTEALQWVREVKCDSQVWLTLPADLKVRLLCFEAGIEIEQKADLSIVKQLSQEADALYVSEESLRLKALITYMEEGVASALRILEKQEDVETLNLNAALLLEMNKFSECSQVIEDILNRLVPNAETYRVRSLMHLCIGDLAQARLDIQEALRREPYWDTIRLAAAMIYYYSAMSAQALPGGVPPWPEPVAWYFIRRDNESLQHLKTSSQFWGSLMDSPDLNVEHRRRIQTWILACMANQPHLQSEAADYCCSVLKEDLSNAYVAAWAVSRSMAVDLTSSITAFDALITKGQASVIHVIVVVTYYLCKGINAKALEILDKTKEIFEVSNNKDIWSYWKSRSLVADKALDDALMEVDLIKDNQNALIAKATVLRAQASEKGDWQPLINHLEFSFSSTGDAKFLFDCCQTKASLGDWTYVADHSAELVEQIGTADALELAAIAAFKTGRYTICLTLLNRYQHLFPDSKLTGNLSRLRIECQLSLGILPRAITEAEELVRQDPTIPNLMTLAQVCLSLGDLKSVVPIARQVESRSDSAPDVCIRLAHLVQWNDQNLAECLWRKAVNSHSLPNELVGAAVSLGFQLGLDSEMAPLIQKMYDLGERAEGGIQAKPVEDLVSFIQQRHEDLSRVNESYRNGEIPVHLLSETLNAPLAAMYHRALRENEMRLCDNKCTPLFFRNGGLPVRTEIDTPINQWRLHMDITSILLAAHLEILEKVEETFKPIYIPASIVLSLLAMRDQITPHQPSRIRSKRRILELIRQSKLKVIDLPGQAEIDSVLVQDLGHDWVALWEYVRKNDGYLVDFLPLKNRVLSGPPTALPEDADSRLINCRGVVESLREHGPLGEAEYIKAIEALGTEGHSEAAQIVPAQNRILTLVATIPEILAEAGLIELVCDRFDVVIEKREETNIENALHENEESQKLSEWLERIIAQISRGLRNGLYEIIPDVEQMEINNEETGKAFELSSIYSLLRFKPQKGDVIWVDDRALTRYRHRDGIPIIGVIEVLDAFLAENKLNNSEYFGLLIKLRASNVQFIPLRKKEILHHLMQARVQNGIVVETQQLAILRRYTANCLVNGVLLHRPVGGMANPGEIPFILGLGREIRDAIISLWETADADLEACQGRADWIMESLYLDDLAYSSVIGLGQTDDVYITALSIANLLFSALSLRARKRQKRYIARRKYFRWLENRMLRSRFAAEPRLIGAVAGVLKRMLDPINDYLNMEGDIKLAGDAKLAKAYIAQQFYEDIPVSLREELSRDQEFIANIGIKFFSVVQIGKVTIKKDEFIQAVSESINGRRGTAKPLDPNEPEVIFEPNTESSASCVSMYPRKNQQVLIDDEIFLILRENPSERELMLRKNRQWFDCSIEQFNKKIPEIATLHDPQRRFEETERWHSSSISVYYQRLSEILNKNHVLARNDLNLPSAEKLCWFLRISPVTGDGEQFQKALYQASEELLKENELFVALERLCALPVPLPLTLLERVSCLDPSARRQLVKTLLRSTGSPLSKMHFLRILTACNEKQYFRLARRIIVHLLGEADTKEFEAFKAILEWVEAESSTWLANGLSYHMRLAMVWVHSHFLYSVIIGAGAPTPWVSKIFRNFSSTLSIELFRYEPRYRYDISHPSQVNCTSFLLSGIAYAFGDKASIQISPQIRERLNAISCYVDENIQLPSPSMFRDASMSMDALSSFLSGDRGQTLKLLLSEEKAAMLSSKSILSTLYLVVDTLGIASNNIGAWTIILNILQGGPPNEDLLPCLVKVFKGTNYSELYKSNAECGLIAMRAATIQMASIQNEDLKTHLIQQILEIAICCNNQTTTAQVYKNGRNMSVRKVGLSLLDCALNISLCQNTDEKVISSFAEITSQIMYVWSQLCREYKDTIQLLCERLPVSACKPIWKLLNMARTF